MDQQQTALRRRRRGEEPKEKPFLQLRNWLNIIFMVGAVAGLATYYFADQTLGTIIILAAMVFKIAESALRFIH